MNKKNKQGKAALLVIDVQQGLFERKTPIYQAKQVLANINLLIERARRAGSPVIFIQHSNEETLVRDSYAWKLHPEIQPKAGEALIHKQHGNAFEQTELGEVLAKANAGTVVTCGLVTHGCVKATTVGALEEGYRVVLAGDAHSNFSADAPKLINKWNRELGRKGAEVLESAQVDFGRLNG